MGQRQDYQRKSGEHFMKKTNRCFLLHATLLLLASCMPPPAKDSSPTREVSAPAPETLDAMTSKSRRVAGTGAPLLANDGQLFLMHYMPWYKTKSARGAWGSHWTGHQQQHDPDVIKENGLPDIWSHYHPLIGLYDTTDPDVIECHLLQMKMAGIHGVIADWYGISDTADYPEIHESTKVLYETAAWLGMQFAVCFEDRTYQLMVEWNKITPAETTNHLTSTFEWLEQNWFAGSHYVKSDDRPLFLNFGPVYLTQPGIWSTAMEPLAIKPRYYALHHLWRNSGADGGFTWVHYDPWEGQPGPDQIKRRIREVYDYCSTDPTKVIVSATPGFRDVYEHPHPRLDHRDGETLREMLDVAMSGSWPIVQLVTWNDYGEGTMIEPTHEFGYTFLSIIQEARQRQSPDTVRATKDDLALPHKLLELRKNGEVDPGRLDKIALAIASGDMPAARYLMGRIERDARH